MCAHVRREIVQNNTETEPSDVESEAPHELQQLGVIESDPPFGQETVQWRTMRSSGGDLGEEYGHDFIGTQWSIFLTPQDVEYDEEQMRSIREFYDEIGNEYNDNTTFERFQRDPLGWINFMSDDSFYNDIFHTFRYAEDEQHLRQQIHEYEQPLPYHDE